MWKESCCLILFISHFCIEAAVEEEKKTNFVVSPPIEALSGGICALKYT